LNDTVDAANSGKAWCVDRHSIAGLNHKVTVECIEVNHCVFFIKAMDAPVLGNIHLASAIATI
jgi:hypothetical protein